jgi:hypothetical protein
MDINYWTVRREQHELTRTLYEEDLHNYKVVVDVVSNLHNLVLELGPIDPPRRGGSRRGKRPHIARGRIEGHEHLMREYFMEDPVYDARMFCQKFRMSKHLFLKLLKSVQNYYSYFVQKPDATSQLGLSGLQKCTTTMRILAYGIASDAIDEYVRLASRTSMLSLKRFVRAIRAIYESTYLRQPTREDLEKQVAINIERGWAGMFASLECMHYEWKNCPTAWQGTFQDREGKKSIILEAIADQSLWIWHAFFGLHGENNDINVLDRSPLIANFSEGHGQDMSFEVNGHMYPHYYLLADGIYPKWTIFVQTNS